MPENDNRWTGRVACDLPARIEGRAGWIPVRIRDLSRHGLRLAVSPGKLGVQTRGSLGAVARQLARLLPEDVVIELRPARLAHLVRRTFRVVRIRPADRHETSLQIGCLFDRPLNDDEIRALGVALPAHGETESEARRRIDV